MIKIDGILGCYIHNGELYPDTLYLHNDLTWRKSMAPVNGSKGWFPTKEAANEVVERLEKLKPQKEAEERLKKFQEKNGMFGFGKKMEEDSTQLIQFGQQQMEVGGSIPQQIFTESNEDAGSEYFDDLDLDAGWGKEESNHIQNARATKHTQLLLENEPIPPVTPIRSRLVTDGEDVILEVQTPSYGLYQSVARLSVNKFGELVMYRTRRIVVDPFIKSDSQGRIQN